MASRAVFTGCRRDLPNPPKAGQHYVGKVVVKPLVDHEHGCRDAEGRLGGREDRRKSTDHVESLVRL
jgi:hypothetical protein